ncbi:response regulator [Endozoicomonas sp. SM1973]|uniref:Response regulator n=1 Tax=Spartinivicinus marinus TaxID=2994442 RepID=A0A853IFD0_9GAMM|nr:response regulator [Spartinivicinus marinus]MCX4027558.1 response regulator [Spartinivicinus marinus]NYZ68197.1 response regulator [Spartinivicinus marinus]
MSTHVLICDDSTVARKQMARALPEEWDVEVSFAKHGQEGMEALVSGKGEVLFLDLNMPVMDGYEVLSEIKKNNLDVMTIVVSGDIQEDARKRVLQLGAIEFIKKPVTSDDIEAILKRYGLYSAANDSAIIQTHQAQIQELNASIGELDCYQEIANVAMGQAAALLAKLLNVFILLPVPKVNMLEVTELQMALQTSEGNDTFSAVCQGFIGSGIAGEALLLFYDSSFEDMAKLLHYEGKLTETIELELVMEVANILIGACIKGIAEQLDIAFSQGHPIVLGQHVDVSRLLSQGVWQWKQTLAIELCYSIENYNISCDLLLLLTDDSMKALREKISYLLT